MIALVQKGTFPRSRPSSPYGNLQERDMERAIADRHRPDPQRN
jgi:hypothetical protein